MAVIWKPALSEEGQRWRDIAVRLSAEHFGPLAEEVDRDQRYPWESVQLLVENGLTGMFIDPQFGGHGASFDATCAVIEEVSRACASTGAILMAYVLGGMPIILSGTDEQRSHYLPKISAGQAFSFALTEDGAGSDVSAIRTTAVRENAGWRINGEKIFIGNGGASQYYVVFARANDAGEERGLTAFIVDKDADGVVIDHLEDKMGIRATQTSNLRLDTLVTDSDVLGEIGRGMRLALQTLNVSRITVAAQSLGVGLAAFELASREACRRTTFGHPVIDNQGISFPLADVATGLSAARILTYEAARTYQAGGDVSILGTMSKLYASEVAHQAADIAVQVFGGQGFCKPCPAERLYRDQRILEIYEGTSEIQRLVLSRAIKSEAQS